MGIQHTKAASAKSLAAAVAFPFVLLFAGMLAWSTAVGTGGFWGRLSDEEVFDLFASIVVPLACRLGAMPITDQHLEYAAALPVWPRHRDMLRGEDAVKARNKSKYHCQS